MQLTIQMLPKSTIWNILGNDNALISLVSVPKQPDQVSMLDFRKQFNFITKFIS